MRRLRRWIRRGAARPAMLPSRTPIPSACRAARVRSPRLMGRRCGVIVLHTRTWAGPYTFTHLPHRTENHHRRPTTQKAVIACEQQPDAFLTSSPTPQTPSASFGDVYPLHGYCVWCPYRVLEPLRVDETAYPGQQPQHQEERHGAQ